MREHKSNLHNVGFAWLYSDQKIDDLALLKRNMLKKYKLDYLTNQFYKDHIRNIVDRANGSYIPGFLTLYNHFLLSENQTDADLCKSYLLTLIESSPNKEYKQLVLRYLSDIEKNAE